MYIVTNLLYMNIKIQDINFKYKFIPNEQVRGDVAEEKHHETIGGRNLKEPDSKVNHPYSEFINHFPSIVLCNMVKKVLLCN